MSFTLRFPSANLSGSWCWENNPFVSDGHPILICHINCPLDPLLFITFRNTSVLSKKRLSSLLILDIQVDFQLQIYSLHSSNNLPRITTLSSSQSSNRFTTVTRSRRHGPVKKNYRIYSRSSSTCSRKHISSSTHWTKFPMTQGLTSWQSFCRFKQAGEVCSSPHVHCKCLSPLFQMRCSFT